ncbi:MAG TPA: hypothetical protein VM122_13645 [Usitatibacter sp.]|nr:hypothetical protein [Usitatibacter sp.]
MSLEARRVPHRRDRHIGSGEKEARTRDASMHHVRVRGQSDEAPEQPGKMKQAQACLLRDLRSGKLLLQFALDHPEDRLQAG